MPITPRQSIVCIMYFPAIAESASQPSRVVPKSHFSEHVKAMHKEKDSEFEREYLVGLYSNVICNCTHSDVIGTDQHVILLSLVMV